jgi:single-strand DNA-binding protein
MYAKLTIVGNLGRDPELRYTADGIPVCSFSVATSRRVPDGPNGYKDVPTWWRVTTWRKLAENCQRFLAKGRRVLVEAEVVKAHGYKTRDGEVAASLEITADRVVFLSSREDGSGSPSARPRARDERLGDLEEEIEGIHGVGPGGSGLPDDEEIPF